ncbi:MAG: hypothetical protein K2G96_04905 [Clostridia bacterium]|nr:hypothetical protein [Clostridia bacterium]
MNKPFVKNVLAVILSIALLIEIYELFSLLIGSFIVKDVMLFTSDEDMNKIVQFARWSSVGVGCLLVPALLCSVFGFFSKGRLLKIFSAAIWLAVAVTCMTLLFVLRKIVLDMLDINFYEVAAELMDEMLLVAIPAILICVYFILDSVLLFGKKEVKANEEA